MSQRSGVGTLAELLRGHRFAAGLGQRALTGRAGISVRTLRYLEQGQIRRPHADSVQRLAVALDLPDAARTRLLAAVEAAAASPRTAGVRVTVLGPLALHRLGGPVEIPSTLQRSLLGRGGRGADSRDTGGRGRSVPHAVRRAADAGRAGQRRGRGAGAAAAARRARLRGAGHQPRPAGRAGRPGRRPAYRGGRAGPEESRLLLSRTLGVARVDADPQAAADAAPERQGKTPGGRGDAARTGKAAGMPGTGGSRGVRSGFGRARSLNPVSSRSGSGTARSGRRPRWPCRSVGARR